MDRLRALLLRLRALVKREEVERELEDEIDFHLAMEAEAAARAGLSKEEAKREAVLRFGAVERYKEEARDARGLGALDQLRQDLRLSLRMMRKQPAFTVATVLTLALGIGANTAIFSAVDAVLLGRSPFRAPDRLVMVWETDRNSDTSHEPASWPDIADFRERSRTLSAIGAMAGYESTLTGPGAEPERVAALGVTPNLLELLGVKPVAGRLFAPGEGAFGGPQVALLSEDFWRRRFGADPAVVGSTITINEQPTSVVGIVPARADLGIQQVHARADYSAPFTGRHVDVWLGVEPTAQAFPRNTHPFLTIGRLAPGATVAGAREEMAGIAADLEGTYRADNDARGVHIEPYSDVVFGAVRTPLLLLLGAAVLVLLVTCANVGNLLLARTAGRAREVAVRRALGAGTRRIARQFLVEGLVLTALGAAAGVALAFVGLRTLVALAPSDIPRLELAAVNGRALVFTAAASVLVALVFALFPALQSRRIEIQDTLKAQPGRGSSEAAPTRRLRSSLVVAEVALAVALAVGAGLLLRSLWNLQAVDPGFHAAHVLKAQYQLPRPRYRIDFSKWPQAPEIQRVHGEFLRGVQSLPAVESAALATPYPLAPGFTNSFVIVGREAESQDFPEIRTRFVTPGYLTTVGGSLLRGRFLAAGDVGDAPAVIVINRSAAERYFSGRDPIGQQIQFWSATWRIVGVIGDEHFQGVDRPPEPAAYGAYAQAPQTNATLLVRTSGDPSSLLPAIRARLHDADPQLALYGAETLDDALASSIARPRFTAALLGLFAAVALLLALDRGAGRARVRGGQSRTRGRHPDGARRDARQRAAPGRRRGRPPGRDRRRSRCRRSAARVPPARRPRLRRDDEGPGDVRRRDARGAGDGCHRQLPARAPRRPYRSDGGAAGGVKSGERGAGARGASAGAGEPILQSGA